MKYLHVMKHLLQNKSFLNKSVCLSESYHIYNQNVCFDAVSCTSLAVFNMQYLHHALNSEILHIDFCHNCLLICLTDCVLDHMLDHDCEMSSGHMSL